MACMMFAAVAIGCSAGPGDQDGAGGSPDAPARCSDRAWSTYSTAPIAAEGTAPPFTGREALAGRLVDTDAARELRWLTVGTAPGWGCEAPNVVAVGVLEDLPAGDPWGVLEELAPSTATDMGEGFVLYGFELPEAVVVPAGLGPWIVVGIERTSCGVKAQLDVSRPRGMHWTEKDGWQEVDSQLVMGAGGCEIECPAGGDDDPCVRYVVQGGRVRRGAGMLRGAMMALSAALLVGCGEAVGETACEPWLDEPAVSTIGPAPVVLLVRLDPTEAERTISAVRAVPCEGAAGPTRFGAWSSEGALSPDDPRDHLGSAPLEPVTIPAGAFAWVAVDLTETCVALGADEPPGVESLTWHPEDGWQAIDGQALISPVECE